MTAAEILSYLLIGIGLLCGWWWLTGSFPWKQNPFARLLSSPAGRQDPPAAPVAAQPISVDEQCRLLEEMRVIKQMLAEILRRLDAERPATVEQPAAIDSVVDDPLDLLPLEPLEEEAVEQDPTEEVYALADRGLTSRDIAREVGLSRAEVDLLLRLRAVAVAVGE